VHRLLNYLHLMYVRAADEHRRPIIDDELAEWPALVPVPVERQRRGRRPAGWGDGDDDEIERDAALSALATMRAIAPRRR
jgi:hypothetical protein